MTCVHCHPRWRGMLPILGVLSLIAAAAATAYEVGRYHRSLAEATGAAADRVQWIRVIPVAPVYKDAEPNHEGHR